MTSTTRPAVERSHPPRAPYRIVNRVMRWLLTSPQRAQGVGRHLLLLHLAGRRTGRRFVLPVTYREAEDGRLLVLTNSGRRANLRGSSAVSVTMFGVCRPARAELVEDPDAVAAVYQRLIEEVGHQKAGRRMGIRINVPRTPTHTELVDAARSDGLSLIYLKLEDLP